MKGIHKIGIFAGVVMIACSCTGCVKIESSSPEDGYNTDVAMSAVEYSIFLSKQISVLENVLMTRMSMAEMGVGSTYDNSVEIKNTEEAISKVTAINNELFVTLPAEGLDTDRQNILNLSEQALDILIDYRDNLKNNDSEALKISATEMKNCMLALSGEANVYYQ